jgi:2-amino-4-hydroxy-6-hydroxymethyldihydropteridine diphosphokinase
MNTAYLLIGGNLGDRFFYLEEAKRQIEINCGHIVTSSSIYETAAWGITEQPNFLNQVLVIETMLIPENLLQKLLSIEEKMGRIRNIKLGPRTIDIDILLIDDLIIRTNTLSVPHPALTERKFALIPLDEVAADLMHPVEKKSIQQLLLNCTDVLDVQKKSVNA